MILLGFRAILLLFPPRFNYCKGAIWQALLRPQRAESIVDNSGKLFGFIILDLGINVHSYLAVFVSGQILNRLRIDARMDQIRDISMPKKMGCHIEIQTIGDMVPVDTFLPWLRLELLFDCLTVDVSVERPFLGAADFNIVPNALELRIGQRFAIAVSDDVF